LQFKKFRGKRSLGAGIVAIMILSGCDSLPISSEWIPSLPAFAAIPSVDDVLPKFSNTECASVSPQALKQVNWARVPEVNMRIRNDEFEPMIVQMTQGWPYSFKIRNRDDEAHVFHAAEFFKNIALVRLAIEGERQDETCIVEITVPPHTTVEMNLVAAVDGHYEFRDSLFSGASLISGGADGVIIVEERTKGRYN